MGMVTFSFLTATGPGGRVEGGGRGGREEERRGGGGGRRRWRGRRGGEGRREEVEGEGEGEGGGGGGEEEEGGGGGRKEVEGIEGGSGGGRMWRKVEEDGDNGREEEEGREVGRARKEYHHQLQHIFAIQALSIYCTGTYTYMYMYMVVCQLGTTLSYRATCPCRLSRRNQSQSWVRSRCLGRGSPRRQCCPGVASREGEEGCGGWEGGGRGGGWNRGQESGSGEELCEMQLKLSCATEEYQCSSGNSYISANTMVEPYF